MIATASISFKKTYCCKSNIIEALFLFSITSDTIVVAGDTTRLTGALNARWSWNDTTGWLIKRMETKLE